MPLQTHTGRLRRRLRLLAWIIASILSWGVPAAAQQCKQLSPTGGLTSTGPYTALPNNTINPPNCNAWALTWSTTGFSAITIELQGSDDGSSWTTFTGSSTVLVGNNPASTLSGAIIVQASATNAFVRVNLTSATGTGAVSFQIYGYNGVTPAAKNGGSGTGCSALGGDLSGTCAAATVVGIENHALTGVQGNGAKAQLSTGSPSPGDCTKFDSNGNTVDAGAPCGSSGAAPYVTSASGSSASIPITTHTQGPNPTVGCFNGPVVTTGGVNIVSGASVLCTTTNDGAGNLTIAYTSGTVSSISVSGSGTLGTSNGWTDNGTTITAATGRNVVIGNTVLGSAATGSSVATTLSAPLVGATILNINTTDSSLYGPFNFVAEGFSGVNPDGRTDWVASWGWNIGTNGAPLVAGQPAARMALESHFEEGGNDPALEIHPASFYGTNGTEYRPIDFFFTYTSNQGHLNHSIATWSNQEVDFFDTSHGNEFLKIISNGSTAGSGAQFLFVGSNVLDELSNNVQWLSQSNAAGTTQIPMIYVNGSDKVVIDPATKGTFVQGKMTVNDTLTLNSGLGGDLNFGANTAIFGSNQSWRIQNQNLFGASNSVIGFSLDTHAYDTIDTTICRSSAGVLEINSGAGCGTGGTLSLATVTMSGSSFAFNGKTCTIVAGAISCS